MFSRTRELAIGGTCWARRASIRLAAPGTVALGRIVGQPVDVSAQIRRKAGCQPHRWW
jgi:hypothetical protein